MLLWLILKNEDDGDDGDGDGDLTGDPASVADLEE